MPPLRTVGFVVNEEKPGAAELGRALEAIARDRGVMVRTTGAFPIPEDYLAGCDACCVIGGDGTLLGAVRSAARYQVPVIGVNRGSLGFLTTFSADEAKTCFDTLLDGNFEVDQRLLLECSTGEGQHDIALNDVLIKAEVNSRLVRLEVVADEELVTEYFSDGLIFSTPTGSTAYNLSAGGPLIHPSADVIAMTPICPHTLSNRSIIFRREVKLRVYNRNSDSALLVAIDGQRNLLTCKTSPIEIKVSPMRLPLVQKRDYEHFAVLRTKLHWSGGVAERLH